MYRYEETEYGFVGSIHRSLLLAGAEGGKLESDMVAKSQSSS